MSIEQEIRDQIENIKKLKQEVGYINNHLSILEGFCREDKQNQVDDAYKRGLEDAWEAARKIGHASQMLLKDMGFEFNNDDRLYNPSWYAVMNYTASEAIAKLKAYEEKQKADDEIKVGDEVIAPCGKAIVTAFHNKFVNYLYSDGDCGCTELENLTKTGKNYDIASILKEMKEC